MVDWDKDFLPQEDQEMIQDTEADLRDVIRQQRETMDLMEKGFQYAKALNKRAAELLARPQRLHFDWEVWKRDVAEFLKDAGLENEDEPELSKWLDEKLKKSGSST
jgi:hypothetical protein